MAKILQWNCHSAFNKHSELETLSITYDFIILSETWLNSSQKFLIRNFDIIRQDRNGSKGGGTAILIRNGIKYSTYSITNNCNNKIEACAIKTPFGNKSFYIVSCYKPPYIKVSYLEWQSFFSQFNEDFIICGDFNCHHTSWGNPSCGNEGIILHDILTDLDICTLNDGKPTFHNFSNNTKSAIDLSLVQSNNLSLFSWDVLEDPWGSDHFPISIEISPSIAIPYKVYNKSNRLYKPNTVWATIKDNLENIKDDCLSLALDNSIDTQTKYSSFVALIQSVFPSRNRIKSSNSKTQSSNSSIKEKEKSTLWWNAECEELIKTRKEALENFKKSGTMDNFLKYKQICGKIKSTFRKAKKESFINFCKSLNKFTNLKHFWQVIKGMANKFNRKDNANEYNPKTIDQIHKSIDSLCPSWVESPPPNLFNPLGEQFLEEPFSMEEINVAIEPTKVSSAPGSDGIDYRIIKTFNETIRYSLLVILNEIFLSGIFPNEWHQFLVFFIPKKDSEKYRPISLAQCLLKILERMIYNRLNWWVELHEFLPSSQYGFRNGKSCTDNLTYFHSDIQLGFEKHESTAAIFLDVQGAYDNVLWEILIPKLKSIGLPQMILQFVYNLIHKRIITMRYESIDEIRTVFKGLPQGCVLSPILYSLYVLDLEKHVQNHLNINILQFADDVCLYSKDLNPNKAVVNLETGIADIASWFVQQGLSLAPQKTQLCIFSRNILFRKAQYSLNLLNEPISNSKSVKFLGVIFQNDLRWNEHISALSNSCQKPLNIISFLRTTWWGASPPLLLYIYQALIRSRLDYACLVWNHLPKYLLNKIERIRLKGIRSALGYQQTTPSNVVLAEAKEPSFFDRCLYLGCSYVSKVCSFSNHPLIPLLEQMETLYESPTHVNALSKLFIYQCYQRTSQFKHLFYLSCSSLLANFPLYSLYYHPFVSLKEGRELEVSFNIQKDFDDLFPSSPDCVDLATDGSKTKDQEFVGFAVYSSTFQFQGRAPGSASIFTAEAMAIICALREARVSAALNFRIFSDSMSVLGALASSYALNKISPLILMIKNLCLILELSGKNVQFFWIPSHQGIFLNEQADALAKDAIKNGTDSSIPIPCLDFKAIWKEDMYHNFFSSCILSSQTKGRNYFEIYFNTNKKPWFYKSPLSRQGVVSIIRIRASRTAVASDLFKINITDSPACQCELYIQTVNHIMWQCHLFAAEREQMTRTLRSLDHFGPYCIEEFVFTLEKDCISAIAKFISNISLKI